MLAQSIHRIRRYAGFAASTVSRQGLVESLADLASELAFDLRYRSNTVWPGDLDRMEISGGNRTEAVQYQGVSPRLVKALFHRLPREAFDAPFIDLGAGKGRVLILAAGAGFPRRIGVEFAAPLAALCRRNLEQAGVLAEVVEQDAAGFPLPAGPLVVFLYNPFTGGTLARVAERLREHAGRHPVWILYVNPQGLATFTHLGFREVHRICRGGIPAAVLLRVPNPA
jgi:SAM-dependent methyltransferase